MTNVVFSSGEISETLVNFRTNSEFCNFPSFYVRGKLVDNFSHESDVTNLQDLFKSLLERLLSILLLCFT